MGAQQLQPTRDPAPMPVKRGASLALQRRAAEIERAAAQAAQPSR